MSPSRQRPLATTRAAIWRTDSRMAPDGLGGADGGITQLLEVDDVGLSHLQEKVWRVFGRLEFGMHRAWPGEIQLRQLTEHCAPLHAALPGQHTFPRERPI